MVSILLTMNEGWPTCLKHNIVHACNYASTLPSMHASEYKGARHPFTNDYLHSLNHSLDYHSTKVTNMIRIRGDWMNSFNLIRRMSLWCFLVVSSLGFDPCAHIYIHSNSNFKHELSFRLRSKLSFTSICDACASLIWEASNLFSPLNVRVNKILCVDGNDHVSFHYGIEVALLTGHAPLITILKQDSAYGFIITQCVSRRIHSSIDKASNTAVFIVELETRITLYKIIGVSLDLQKHTDWMFREEKYACPINRLYSSIWTDVDTVPATTSWGFGARLDTDTGVPSSEMHMVRTWLSLATVVVLAALLLLSQASSSKLQGISSPSTLA